MCIKPLHVLSHDGAEEELPDDPDLSLCRHGEAEDADEAKGESPDSDEAEVEGILLGDVHNVEALQEVLTVHHQGLIRIAKK